MANFAQGLGNLSAIYNGAQSSYDSAQIRRQQMQDDQLRQTIMRQNAQQQQQEWALKQQELMRGNNAARAAVGAMGGAGASPGGLPNQVQVPGAKPMPSMPGGMQMGPQGMAPMRPPASSMTSQLPPQGGGMPPSPPPMLQRPGAPQQPQMGAQPNQGGGIGLQELGDRVRGQLGPDADPLTVYEAMKDYQAMMKPQDADEYKRIGLMIQEMRLENQTRSVDQKEGQTSTARREMDNRAYGLGIDPMGMDDKALSKAIAAKSGTELGGKDAKRDRLPVAEERYKLAKDDVKTVSDDIKAIIKAHPNAVGAYGKIYKGIGSAYGFLKEPEPQDAAAANALKPKFEQLEQALGMAGSYGGMGASTLTKRWGDVMGGTDWVTNPQRITDTLDSINGNLDRFKEQSGGEAPNDIDALVNKYNQPGQ